MLLHCQTSTADYGRLVPLEEDGNAVDSTSRGIGVPPGEGLIVLEIQQRKLCFLRTCVQLILHDLPINHMVKALTISEQYTPNSIEGFPSKNPEWPSLSKELLEAPYRVPDELDLVRLSTFVFARRSETEDYIWDLREDPAYFKKTVLDWSEHRQEKILDINGKEHHELKKNIFWERVLWDVVVDAYSNFLSWDRLSQDITQLMVLKDRCLESITPTPDLPQMSAEAARHFSYCLDQMIKGSLRAFRCGMPASPPLRNQYHRVPQSPTTDAIQVVTKSAHQRKKDEFLWLLESLLIDQQIELCGLENLLDEIERMLCSDPECHTRMSSWLAQNVSDLALSAELKRQIELFSLVRTPTEVVSSKDLSKEVWRRMEPLATNSP